MPHVTKNSKKIEAIRLAVNNIITALNDTQPEYMDDPLKLNGEELAKYMTGYPLWDNPPDEWSESDLLQFSRGYLAGLQAYFTNINPIIKTLFNTINDEDVEQKVVYCMLMPAIQLIVSRFHKSMEESLKKTETTEEMKFVESVYNSIIKDFNGLFSFSQQNTKQKKSSDIS